MEIDKATKKQRSLNEGHSDDEDYLFMAAKSIAIKIFQEGRIGNNASGLASQRLPC